MNIHSIKVTLHSSHKIYWSEIDEVIKKKITVDPDLFPEANCLFL